MTDCFMEPSAGTLPHQTVASSSGGTWLDGGGNLSKPTKPVLQVVFTAGVSQGDHYHHISSDSRHR
jgi:hypothetical protein